MNIDLSSIHPQSKKSQRLYRLNINVKDYTSIIVFAYNFEI